MNKASRLARYARLLPVTLAVAGAFYLLPASVHVVAWNGPSASRVALLPPLNRFLWAAAILVVTMSVCARVWEHRGGTVEQVGRVSAPLCLLGLWWVPFLPWLSSQAPIFLTLAGPFRWGVAGLAVIGCLWTVVGTTRGRGMQAGASLRGVLVISFCALLLIGFHTKHRLGLGGDEPHYLMISHSLLVDGDLQIENNHQERHYAAFFANVLSPHYLYRGQNGAIYSVHAPGLPTLLLPVYAAAGQWGAMAFMVLLGALAAQTVYRVSERLTSRRTAAVVWLVFTFSIPFALQSSLIYPELPAALIMAWSVLWLFSPAPGRFRSWLWRGAALGLLPWLHTKFVVLEAITAFSLLLRLWRQPRLALAFAGPMVVSTASWLLFFYVIYGTPNPTIPYAGQDKLELLNVPRGVLGLLFDQEFGLLMYSPVFALAPLGCWLMLRRRDLRWPTLALMLTVAGFVSATAQYYMWWGGSSVPARFLVPLLPLLAPALAVAVDHLRNPAGRGLVAATVGGTLVTLAVVVAEPGARLMYNTRDGSSRLVETLQSGVPVTTVLPSFIGPDWIGELPRLAPWIAAAVLVVAVTLAARQLKWQAFRTAAVAVLTFGVSAALLTTPRLAEQETRASLRHAGQTSLIAAFDGSRLRRWNLETWQELTADELGRLTAFTERPAAEPADLKHLVGPIDLPPGRYDIVVGFHQRFTPPAAALQAMYHRGPGILAQSTPSPEGFAVMALDLPVRLPSVWVGTADPAVARAIQVVRVVPRSIVPRSLRPEIGNVRVAQRLGAGYIFYTDEGMFAESDGYWVRGQRSAQVFVAPRGASALEIRLRNGASAGPVMVNIAGAGQELMLSSGERRQVRVSLSGQESLVPIIVSTQAGFRPSDVNPDSRDRRWLGCFVQIVPVGETSAQRADLGDRQADGEERRLVGMAGLEPATP